MLVPFSYNLRSLFVRRASTFLTVAGIGATVAVVAGVLSLERGFQSLFAESGREDIAVFLRPGAQGEGDSFFTRNRALTLIKKVPEIAVDENEQPLAAIECYLAIRRNRIAGGETNVPVRGVQPQSLEIYGDDLRIIEGRAIEFGADEVLVGSKLPGRMQDCQVGDVIELNTTPFRVVGILDHEGSFSSEIWGDLDRMLEALQRSPNRVVARVRDGVDIEELDVRMREDKEVPAKAMSERAYLTSQTAALSITLLALGGFLGIVMGLAAVFTATNTMLSAVSSRTHEIGILLSSGFRPFPIFLSFLLEALLLGLLGGIVGCLLALPLNGIETGTTNFNTFTEIGFAFSLTPAILGQSVAFAVLLGLFGGAIPAWRAARLTPTEALRRR